MRSITRWMMAGSAALAACGSGHDGGDSGEGAPTTITIKAIAQTPDAIAFRDDADPTWHMATSASPTESTIVVTGPYWVSVVCHGYLREAPYHYLQQLGRTLDDPHELDIGDDACPKDSMDSPGAGVRGTMVQPGRLVITDQQASGSPNWTFSQAMSPGTPYTLYAASASHLLIQRNLVADESEHYLELPPIDVDADGTALTATPFSYANAQTGATVTLEAAVGIQSASMTSASTDHPLYVYLGAPATALIVPSDAMTSDDVQTVSLREITQVSDQHTSLRAYRRAFKVGESTGFTMPDPIGNLAWSADSEMSISWRSLPDNMPFLFELQGGSHVHTIDASASFLRATSATHVAFDTHVTGFQADWQIDLTLAYALDVYGQSRGSGVATDPVISVSDQQTFNLVHEPARRALRSYGGTTTDVATDP